MTNKFIFYYHTTSSAEADTIMYLVLMFYIFTENKLYTNKAITNNYNDFCVF